MNTRKDYLTFEELCTCCAQEESRIITKDKSKKNMMIKPSKKAKQNKTYFFF